MFIDPYGHKVSTDTAAKTQVKIVTNKIKDPEPRIQDDAILRKAETTIDLEGTPEWLIDLG